MAKSAQIKHLWRGKFLYNQETYTIYAFAFSREQARVIMCRRLAKKHDVDLWIVLSLFKEGHNNFSIEKEIEFMETDDEK